MEGNNASVQPWEANGSRSQWPGIGADDLLPDDLSRGLKLTFIAAYTTIILLALGGNGLMVNEGRPAAFKPYRMRTKGRNESPRSQP